MERLKNQILACTPTAPKQAHLLAAAGLWSLAGSALAGMGLRWLQSTPLELAVPILFGALLLGGLKAQYVLSRTARRILARIEQRGDGHCLGGFLSWQNWLLVVGFSLGGRLLRISHVPRSILGGIYLAVGLALFISSLVLWIEWWRSRRPPPQ